MLTEEHSSEPLTWLSHILWPDGSTSIEPGRSAGAQWWASPSAAHPKILIPAGSGAVARTAVKRYHDGFTARLRLRSLLAETMMAFQPAARFGLRNKLVGSRSIDEAERLQGPAVDVIEEIRELLDVPALHVAVSLSVPKSNRKPVLQLIGGDGRCLGWAKVAWNDRTDALVGNEASWLRRRPSGPLSMPRLLHDEVIAGRRVVITSGLPPSRRPRRRRATPPPAALFLAVAALGDDEVGIEVGIDEAVAIERSPWWRSVEAVLDHATDREQEVIAAALASCDGLRFRLGAWHGDLTPWNLMTAGRRIHLIDWEFAADGVPVGFDLCHFHTQVASEMKPRTATSAPTPGPRSSPATGGAPAGDAHRAAARALDRSARLSPQGLAELGVDPNNRLAVWRLYLVELIRRQVALRADGYPIDSVTQGPAALDRLERVVGRCEPAAPVEPPWPIDPPHDRPVEPDQRPTDRTAGHRRKTDPDPDPVTEVEPVAEVEPEVAADSGDGFTIREHRSGVSVR